MAYTNFNDVEKKCAEHRADNGTFHTDLRDYSKPI